MITVLLLISITSFAQIYFSASAGYGINQDLFLPSNLFGPLTYSGYNDTYSSTYNSMYYSTQGNNSSSTATSDNRDVPHSSFGGGLSIGGTVDYGLNEHLSVEIGINYLTGNLITIEDYSTNTSNNTSFYPGYTYNNSNSNINTTDIKYTIKAGSRVRFMPALKISSKTSTFTIYLKGGLVVGIGATINFNEEYGRFSGSTCSGGGGNTSTSNSNSYALTASK